MAKTTDIRIEVIETFLQEFKEKVILYVMNLRKEYVEGEGNNWGMESSITGQQKEKLAVWGESYLSYFCKNNWMKLSKWHKMAAEYSDDILIEELEILLNKDIEAKRYSLISKVEKIVGTITDASNLSVGYDGDINGIIIGTDGKCNVSTISAGGYNIQCYHFRCLVKKLKK